MQHGAHAHSVPVTPASLLHICEPADLLIWTARPLNVRLIEGIWMPLNSILNAKQQQYGAVQQLDRELSGFGKKCKKSSCCIICMTPLVVLPLVINGYVTGSEGEVSKCASQSQRLSNGQLHL